MCKIQSHKNHQIVVAWFFLPFKNYYRLNCGCTSGSHMTSEGPINVLTNQPRLRQWGCRFCPHRATYLLCQCPVKSVSCPPTVCLYSGPCLVILMTDRKFEIIFKLRPFVPFIFKHEFSNVCANFYQCHWNNVMVENIYFWSKLHWIRTYICNRNLFM